MLLLRSFGSLLFPIIRHSKRPNIFVELIFAFFFYRKTLNCCTKIPYHSYCIIQNRNRNDPRESSHVCATKQADYIIWSQLPVSLINKLNPCYENHKKGCPAR